MTALFVDTAGWMALSDEADPRHQHSRTARDEWLRRGSVLVTTDYIIDETLTLLRMRLSLKAAAQWWEQVGASPRVRWELIDAARSEKARQWFFRWEDKDFSFTDCTSFVVMKELRLNRALTTDRHFEQAGFQLVP